MHRLILITLLFLLPGCAAVGNLPTMEYCSNVSYVRTGNQIKIAADCAAPIKDASMPLPPPIGAVVK